MKKWLALAVFASALPACAQGIYVTPGMAHDFHLTLRQALRDRGFKVLYDEPNARAKADAVLAGTTRETDDKIRSNCLPNILVLTESSTKKLLLTIQDPKLWCLKAMAGPYAEGIVDEVETHLKTKRPKLYKQLQTESGKETHR